MHLNFNYRLFAHLTLLLLTIPNLSFGKVGKPKGCAKWSYERIIEASKPYQSTIGSETEGKAVSKELVTAIIVSESCFNKAAVSPAGAVGLMQLMPATAARFGVSNRLDAKQSINGGVRYLEFLFHKFNSIEKVIAGYNAGEGSVMKYGGVPPYRETQQYLINVKHVYRALLDKASLPSMRRIQAPPVFVRNEISAIKADLLRAVNNQSERITTGPANQANGFVQGKAPLMKTVLSGFK